MLVQVLGAGNKACDLLLFDPFPANIILDIRVIGIDRDHLRRTARGATRFNGSSRTIANPQERHQARRLAAATQGFALTPQRGKVRTCAGAVFEETSFTDPKIHDAAIVHQIVGNGLNETSMRLWVLIGGLGLCQTAGFIIDVVVTLTWAIDPVSPMQAGVEPLG